MGQTQKRCEVRRLWASRKTSPALEGDLPRLVELSESSSSWLALNLPRGCLTGWAGVGIFVGIAQRGQWNFILSEFQPPLRPRLRLAVASTMPLAESRVIPIVR